MIYDFIEIGTSDFRTIVEGVSDSVRGLCVEPIPYYLDRLPERSAVSKVQAAISNFDGTMQVYYISPDKFAEYNLPNWVRGCNSVNKPHPTVLNLLGESKYSELVTIETVSVKSFRTLVDEYSVSGIKYLKIDTEGHDGVILLDYLDLCENNKELYAQTILFENNVLADTDQIQEVLNRTQGLYKVQRLPDDIKLERI